MRKGLKIARGLQLLGCVFLIVGIVACSAKSDPSTMSMSFLVGFVLVVGARVYEWMSKE